MDKQDLKIQLGIVLGAALLFIPFLGKVHLFDWDEINFAESAREMIVSGDYLTVRIFFEPFWEKPPLFIWMQALALKVFGVNEFAARFPNAICGIVTLLTLYNLGKKLYNPKFGLIWALTYCGSILPFFYFKSGIIDPWFNLFIFLGIYLWVVAIEKDTPAKKYLYAALSAATIGLGVLTKGPVSLLVFGMVAFVLFLLNGFRIGLKWQPISLFILVFLLVGGFWFILMALSGNFEIIQDFIVYQVRLFQTKDAGHGGFPMYHFVILLFGVFPASVFCIQGHKYVGERDVRKTMHLAMISLLWIVLLLFSIVKTKIVHYSSLTYFPITYLGAYSIYQLTEGQFRFKGWLKTVLVITGSIPALLIIGLPIFNAYRLELIESGLITHSFTVGNLQANPGWGAAHALVGFLLLAGIFTSVFAFKNQLNKKLFTLLISAVLFIFLSITLFTPGAERISQRAAIEFIKDKADEDVYIHSFYKSYAVLFYGKQGIPADKKQFSTRWLTSDKIDKDAYFVMRIDKKDEILKRYPKVEVLYEKNGYVFGINRVTTAETITP